MTQMRLAAGRADNRRGAVRMGEYPSQSQPSTTDGVVGSHGGKAVKGGKSARRQQIVNAIGPERHPGIVRERFASPVFARQNAACQRGEGRKAQASVGADCAHFAMILGSQEAVPVLNPFERR